MTGSSMRIKLQARDVSLAYQQPRTGTSLLALDRINLDVREGEFVSVVGPSGCGKTTFLSVVDGLIPASGGEILVDGVAVTKPGPDRAVVFQDASLLPWRTVLGNVVYGLECAHVKTREARERARYFIDMVGLSYTLFPWLTVRDNVCFGLRERGLPRAQQLEIAQDFLQKVGLNGFEGSYPHELSGGMQQRVNLARALVMDPKILLMDEPFAALDAQTRETMQEELLRIWLKAGKTVLFITHQIDEAIFLSDRVIVFSGRPGRVRASVDIDIERPRSLRLKRDPRFHALEDRIWGLIQGEPENSDIPPAQTAAG